MSARTLLRPRWPRPTRGASPAHDNNRKGFDPKAEPSGGEEGIRTPGAREGSTVFKTAAIDHSATSPVFLFYRLNRRFAAHERTQCLRNLDRAVALLIVFENRNQRAANGEARAV